MADEAPIEVEFDQDTVTIPRARRTARGTGQQEVVAERRRLLTHALHRPSLNDAVERLRAQAAEYRAKAIALNAKLVLLEAERARLHGASPVELHAVREQLIESSARLDHAVEEIGAVTKVEEQLSTLR